MSAKSSRGDWGQKKVVKTQLNELLLPFKMKVADHVIFILKINLSVKKERKKERKKEPYYNIKGTVK